MLFFEVGRPPHRSSIFISAISISVPSLPGQRDLANLLAALQRISSEVQRSCRSCNSRRDAPHKRANFGCHLLLRRYAPPQPPKSLKSLTSLQSSRLRAFSSSPATSSNNKPSALSKLPFTLTFPLHHQPRTQFSQNTLANPPASTTNSSHQTAQKAAGPKRRTCSSCGIIMRSVLR